MLKLKKIYWALISKTNHYSHWQWLLQNIPCNYGIKLRRRFYTKYFGKVGQNLVINLNVKLINVQNIFVGDDVDFSDDVFLQGAGIIEFGNHVMVGPGSKIWTANHITSDLDVPISQQGYDNKKVVIGNNVWIGANVFIMPGANIGDGVIISAGSIVGGKNIPPYKILAGNPARVIGDRNLNQQ